ncbi:MAG: universal stress protein [Desulfobacterales bacterium]|jgi:nucleotide-binding universal stress UspA family protein|nr:universal stress protein [Desulfobacterales bacterium]
MNFLVGYDNSKATPRALEVAEKYAHAFNAKIHILASTPYGPELEAKEYEETKAALERLKNEFHAEGIDCETHMITRSLSPGEDLVDFARQNQIDKIIIGTRKKSKIGKLLMGSTAQYVILEADCPVIVVK